MNTHAFLASAILLAAQAHSAQNPKGNPIRIPPHTPGMEWFEDAKLGIFLHWGIYAVGQTGESHPINHPVPKPKPEVYFNFAKDFDARNYDPAKWAETFRKAGAKYAILTTKHHDGFALWDTRAAGGFDAADDTPAKRDLIQPFVEAMRAGGIKPGFYFSIADWHHPDYASISSGMIPSQGRHNKPLSYSEKDDPRRWAEFLAFRDAQIAELVKYKPDIWWIDGGWERTPEKWDAKALCESVLAANPGSIFGRTSFPVPGGLCYATPEQGLPTTTVEGPWELCMTTSEFWSYRPNFTKQWKSAPVLARMFSEVIAGGGNLLLNIAPGPDGTLPAEAVNPVLEMGAWIQRNAEAIYGTIGGERAGLCYKRFFGPATVSRTGKSLYLFLHDPPKDIVMLRGIVSTPRSATVLSTGEALTVDRLPGNERYPGHMTVSAPQRTDPLTTVIKLDFDEIIRLGSDAPQHKH